MYSIQGNTTLTALDVHTNQGMKAIYFHCYDIIQQTQHIQGQYNS